MLTMRVLWKGEEVDLTLDAGDYIPLEGPPGDHKMHAWVGHGLRLVEDYKVVEGRPRTYWSALFKLPNGATFVTEGGTAQGAVDEIEKLVRAQEAN
jgi:hypothetical protein